MPFSCPACGEAIDAQPDRLLLRCPRCGVLLRCRPLDSDGLAPAFEVFAAGKRETRRRIELPWDEPQRRRLALWLSCSSAATLGLILVLYVLARLLR